MIASTAGTMFLPGCSSAIGAKSFESTVNPELDASRYNRAYVCYGEHAGFLKADIDAVFVKAGLVLLDNSEFLKGHDSHDLYVVVTVDKGFTVLPASAENPESAYVQPATAALEIQDAVTGKQLMLCSYSRGFLRDGIYGECREILVIELSRVFKDKTDASDKDASAENVIQPQPPPSGPRNPKTQDFDGMQESQKADKPSSSIPFQLPATGRSKGRVKGQ